MEEEKQTVPAKGRRPMVRLRFQTGLAVLFTAMGAMAALVLADMALGGQSESGLIGNAFEAFKLIAVTVLGYIFGTDRGKEG